MNTQNLNEEAQKRKGLKYFHGEAASTGVEEAANAYQSASMVYAGSGFGGVGILSALTNVVTAFLYLQVPAIIKRLGSRKRAIVVLSFLDAISWLPIIIFLMWFMPVSLPLLIALWVVNLVPGMLAGAARNAWLADLTTGDRRGRYLGTRSSIINAVYLASFYVMGFWLQRFSGEYEYIGFALVFLIAFVATSVSFATYTKIADPHPATQGDANSKLSFVDFLHEMRRRNLGRFILFASLFNFTVYIAAPFFSVYMLEDLQFSYIIFAVVSSSELAAKIVAVTFWGKYADKAGNLKILGIACMCIPVVPIMWLASHNVAYLVGVQLLSGAMWAGFDLCVTNFIYSAASPEKRLRYILYHQTLSRMSMALGTLTGVFLLTHITPVLGSKILALFLLSGLLRFAVVATIFPKLREAKKDVRAYADAGWRAPVAAWSAAPNGGLLYRPRHWEHFAKRATTPATQPMQIEARAHAAPVASKPGLFYMPRQWQSFTKIETAAPTAELTPLEAAPNRGLFYRPREWQTLSRQLALAPAESSFVANTSANWGIFYRPQQWSMFREDR